MAQVIIYKQDSGRVSIVRPTEWALEHFDILAIARKDVPEGRPFKIIDSAEVPTDRAERDAWTCDDADLTDGVGAASNDFPGLETENVAD